MPLRCAAPFVQPEDTLGTSMSAHQKSKIDDIWASMNASETPAPGGASGSGLKGGKGKGKTNKKKAAKKANKVTYNRCSCVHGFILRSVDRHALLAGLSLTVHVLCTRYVVCCRCFLVHSVGQVPSCRVFSTLPIYLLLAYTSWVIILCIDWIQSGFAVVCLLSMDLEQVLAGIFGKKVASGIVSGAGKAKRRAGSGDSAARQKALAASRKVEVTEIKKYAGKDIV